MKIGRGKSLGSTEEMILGIDKKLASLKSRKDGVVGNFKGATLEASLLQKSKQSLSPSQRRDCSLDLGARNLENSVKKNKNEVYNNYKRTTGVVNLLSTSDAKPCHVIDFFFRNSDNNWIDKKSQFH